MNFAGGRTPPQRESPPEMPKLQCHTPRKNSGPSAESHEEPGILAAVGLVSSYLYGTRCQRSGLASTVSTPPNR
jgi:hypothetical protein